MGGEAGIAGGLHVGLLAVAAQGDGRQGDALGTQGPQQVQAGAIGQTQIRKQEIKRQLAGKLQGSGHIRGHLDGVAVGREQPGHDPGRIGVVFDQKDPQRAGWYGR